MELDTYKHKGLRKKLCDEIRAKGFADEQVLDAMLRVPRHIFFTKEFEHFAYKDKAFPIDAGQTISQPYTVAVQSHLLQVRQGEKILEVGTGSGYQCAVLCELGANVYSIEYHYELYKKAEKILMRLNYTPHLYHGDGSEGLPDEAPFDKIIVTAGAVKVPEPLLEQLKIGGTLVIPAGETEELQMLRIRRTGERTFEKTSHGIFRFVPLLGGK